jgi:hypothetical protein
LAPKNLYLPILPSRFNNKLVFSNCSNCALLKTNDECRCSKEESLLKGTWVTVEINKAIEKGYKIEKIHEVWHWDETIERNHEEEGLFSGYINSFLKTKQEASGWPKKNMSELEKRKYIQNFYDKEGVLLDSEKINKNPGMRAIAKIMLNSQ